MKAYLLLLLLLFILPSGSAQEFELPTVKKDTCIQLIQTCANCTYVNVSTVQYPNNTILSLNKDMTKTNTVYNLSFCNTQQVGDYFYNTFGDLNGVNTIASVKFTVSKTGDIIQTSNSIIYIFALIFAIALFSLFLFGAIVTPFENERSEEGFLVSISWKKYLKIFFFVMSYLTFLWSNYMVYNIVLGYTAFEGTAQFFYVVHRIAFVSLVPLFSIIVIFTLIRTLMDIRYDQLLKEGKEIQ